MRSIYQAVRRRLPPQKALKDWPAWALFLLATVSALQAWYWFQPVSEVAKPYVQAINSGAPINGMAVLLGFLLLVLAMTSLVFGLLSGSALAILQKRIVGEA